jgi:hypothetical protein
MPKKKPAATTPKKKTKTAPPKTSKFARLSLKARRQRRRAERPTTKLSGSFRLFRDSLFLIREHWKVFGGIILINILLMLALGGFSSSVDVSGSKNQLDQISSDGSTEVGDSASLFGMMLGTVGSATTESAGAYQTVMIILISLATIWTLRQSLASQKLGIRNAFYQGMHPLVPFVLVLFVIGLEFIPFFGAMTAYDAAFNNGLAVGFIEKVFWIIVVFLLTLSSLYMLSSSIFALYIVTLPNMLPLQALRSAGQLVRYRRWTILRKLLFLPLALLVIGALIIIPLILLLPIVAQIMFVVLTMVALVLAHTYAYNLYRELL